MSLPPVPDIIDDSDAVRRTLRLRDVTRQAGAREFVRRREGMIHAMDGGLWLHRHVWNGRPMVHMVSTDRARLLAYGLMIGMPERRLQFKPLRDPRTLLRVDAWHWDLGGPVLPPPDDTLIVQPGAHAAVDAPMLP